jgi:uncharacterized protein (DUF302 family)
MPRPALPLRHALAACGLLAIGAMAVLPDSGRAQTTTPAAAAKPVDGVIRVKSAYGMAETIARIKADIAAKGIMFFTEIDQAKLAANAKIALRPSVLLVFGNPPLGTQFIAAKPEAGLDWPVRMLVFEDARGQVWIAYTDFDYIARRHGIANRAAQFKMAGAVAASIASSATAK